MTIEQNTAAWHSLRAGKATASRIKDVMAKGSGASRATYMTELICERLSGVQQEGFESEAMREGKRREPESVAAYEFKRNVETTQMAFVDHATIPMCGCSPDRLVGADGLLELKNPQPKQHLAWLLAGKVPPEYEKQMVFQMACTGRRWCDFASYSPAFPEPMQLFIVRLDRDPARIVEIEREVRAFLAELDAKMDEIAKRFPAVMPLAAAAE